MPRVSNHEARMWLTSFTSWLFEILNRRWRAPSPRLRGETSEARSERVGVRGTLRKSQSRRVPLTPRLRCRFVSDLSPHAGRGGNPYRLLRRADEWRDRDLTG
jgi:hypothetical protein